MATAQEDESFAEFFAVYWGRAFRTAVMLGVVDAEDAAQEAFSRLQPRFLQLQQNGTTEAYLFTSIRNLANSRWRRLRTLRHIEARMPQSKSDSWEPADVDAHLALRSALMKLPLRQREVVVLRYWLDWTEAQISDQLNISPGSVKTHCSRGLTRLRNLMEASNVVER